MRPSHDDLIRIAKETAEKSALSDPGLVAIYLTGSLRSDHPFLGNATDIDIVYVHAQEPKTHREILPLSAEIHLDIIHNPRNLYEKPRELRVHPWLGPELYDPMPLYIKGHLLEFIQAGVRDRFYETSNVLVRSQRLQEQARQVMSDIRLKQPQGPRQILEYLKSIRQAANAVAVLVGEPLAERRFLLEFPVRAMSAGQPELTKELSSLLGTDRVEGSNLAEFLVEWEKDFLGAAEEPGVDSRIALARLGYYKLAFEFLLASEAPQTMLWPMLLTWAESAAVLPAKGRPGWSSACTMLGLDEDSFPGRLESLEHFLSSVEALQTKFAANRVI